MRFLLGCTLVFSMMSTAFAEERALALLERDLTPVIKTFSKETRLYSYFSILKATSELTNPAGRSAFLRRFLDSQYREFWNPETKPSNFMNAGAGLYVAIDPVVSKRYGNTLIELGVPAETKYLDLFRSATLGEDTTKALIDEAYVPPGMLANIFNKNEQTENYEFSNVTLKTMLNPQYSAFKKLIQKLVTKNSIIMAQYMWESDLDAFCRVHRKAAFIVFGIDPKLKRPDSLKKTIIYFLPLPQMNAEEAAADERVKKFMKLLMDLKDLTGYKTKVDYVRAYYPDKNERNDLMNKTYSCEK